MGQQLPTDQDDSAIKSFLEANDTIVLATADDTGPHAAIVYYKSSAKCGILFFTHRDTRKAEHMRKNPQVAFVVADKDKVSTLQGYGTVSEILEADVLKDMYTDLLGDKAKSEHGWATPVEKFSESSVVALEIKPIYMRLTDYGQKGFKPEVFEKNF